MHMSEGYVSLRCNHIFLQAEKENEITFFLCVCKKRNICLNTIFVADLFVI